MHKSITIIVKISGICNLNCSYCYYLPSSKKQTQSIMSNELIEELINQASMLANDIEFIWHGGEPLLAGCATFEKIIKIQQQLSLERNIKFRNKIQTNATRINSKWVEIFKVGDFGLGVSLDGSQWIHDEGRKYQNGIGSFHKVMTGVKKLQDSQIDFAVLSVVSKKSLNLAGEIFDFFIAQGFNRFDFLPLVEVDEKGQLLEGSLNPGDFSQFMIEIFNLWISRDDVNISIRYLEQILSTMLGGKPSLCKLSGACKEFITIDHDGSVYPCDNFVGYDELKYGSLSTHNLMQIINKKKVLKIKRTLSQVHKECKKCDIFQFCHGGCNKYRYLWEKDFSNPFYFCDDTKIIVNHIQKYLATEHPLLLGVVSPIH